MSYDTTPSGSIAPPSTLAESISISLAFEEAMRFAAIDKAAAEIRDLRDAICLLLGQPLNIPWHEVWEEGADEYLADIRGQEERCNEHP